MSLGMPVIKRGDFASYSEVCDVLTDMCKERKYRRMVPAVVEEQAFRERLQFTPGLFFSPGTTWDDILNDLVYSGAIQRVYQRGVSYVVPLLNTRRKSR